MLLLEPERLTRRLPAVAISPEMEDKLKALSEAHKLSVSELVRRSIALFLSEIAIQNSNKANEKEKERIA